MAPGHQDRTARATRRAPGPGGAAAGNHVHGLQPQQERGAGPEAARGAAGATGLIGTADVFNAQQRPQKLQAGLGELRPGPTRAPSQLVARACWRTAGPYAGRPACLTTAIRACRDWLRWTNKAARRAICYIAADKTARSPWRHHAILAALWQPAGARGRARSWSAMFGSMVSWLESKHFTVSISCHAPRRATARACALAQALPHGRAAILAAMLPATCTGSASLPESALRSMQATRACRHHWRTAHIMSCWSWRPEDCNRCGRRPRTGSPPASGWRFTAPVTRLDELRSGELRRHRVLLRGGAGPRHGRGALRYGVLPVTGALSPIPPTA